jgi:hypothetical protein
MTICIGTNGFSRNWDNPAYGIINVNDLPSVGVRGFLWWSVAFVLAAVALFFTLPAHNNPQISARERKKLIYLLLPIGDTHGEQTFERFVFMHRQFRT